MLNYRRNIQENFEAEALPYLDELFRIAARITKNRRAAESVIQEVYLQARKSTGFFKPENNCRVRLHKILFDKLKKFHSEENTSAEEAREMFETQNSKSLVAVKFTNEEIISQIEQIPLRFREAMLLADVEELSCAEIAEILGISADNVKTRVSRGRNLLKFRLIK